MSGSWLDLLQAGGGWTLALAIGWAVMTGRLRLDREVTMRDDRIAELKTALDGVAVKAEQTAERQAQAIERQSTEAQKTIEAQRETIAALADRVRT